LANDCVFSPFGKGGRRGILRGIFLFYKSPLSLFFKEGNSDTISPSPSKCLFPLWKRGMEGDFEGNIFILQISPHPSFSKRGI
jgi:hypothetical protein